MATRDEILRTARDIVIEQGADHLTVREIARRTDSKKALLKTIEDGVDDW